jgi:hypothetical protein
LAGGGVCPPVRTRIDLIHHRRGFRPQRLELHRVEARTLEFGIVLSGRDG